MAVDVVELDLRNKLDPLKLAEAIVNQEIILLKKFNPTLEQRIIVRKNI